jgi:lipid II:glycine glycyltransferase (peptidoglycan interpeptide bridge formation enzyme)
MPDEFFRRLYAGGLADIWQVKKDGRCIAAAMFLKGRTEVFYQASGTIRERNEVSAIDALLWTAIRHYRDGGYRTLNLGASEGLDSVRFFKEKFGAVATPYRHVTFVLPKLLVSTAGGTASCR